MQMKTEQTMNSAKDSTNAAADKTASAAQSAKESAQDSNSGFLQQVKLFKSSLLQWSNHFFFFLREASFVGVIGISIDFQ